MNMSGERLSVVTAPHTITIGSAWVLVTNRRCWKVNLNILLVHKLLNSVCGHFRASEVTLWLFPVSLFCASVSSCTFWNVISQYVLHTLSWYVQLSSNFSTTVASISIKSGLHFADHFWCCYRIFHRLYGRDATLPISRLRAVVRKTKDVFTFKCWRSGCPGSLEGNVLDY